MSTRCTVMSSRNEEKNVDYHFYYDQMDGEYHLLFDGEHSLKQFYKRIGKILTQCPFGDSGIYFVSVVTGKSSIALKNVKCGMLEKARRKK